MFANLLRTPRSQYSVVALGKVHGADHPALHSSISTQKNVNTDIVCDVVYDWARFQHDIAALISTLKRVHASTNDAARATSPLHWLLFTENPYAFAVALTALAQSGAVAVLPPNGQSETLQELAPGCVGLLSDRVQLAAPLPTLNPLAASLTSADAHFTAHTLDLNAPLLELCTSGSTGQRKRVLKCVRHIDTELATLEKVFGTYLEADTQIFATASHQHLYGLLFRVLWPLATQRPFRLESFLYPEEILPRMLQARSCALVSTPAHLKRLKDVSGLRALRKNCNTIFSSGGPLTADITTEFVRKLGKAPIEIFGSTETGGVAWRIQSGTEQSTNWITLPGVHIECAKTTGLLRVRSAFASAESGNNERFDGAARLSTQKPDTEIQTYFEMGDRIETLPGGQFRLLGRADRIVKIGEKRLSLPEMEAHLLENPLLQEVALVAIERSGTQRVGAVAVLSEPGRTFLAQSGRRALAQQLIRSLQHHFDRIVLPRAWRYVDRLPEDAQGKVPSKALRSLFDEKTDILIRERSTVPHQDPPSTIEDSAFAQGAKQPIILYSQRTENGYITHCRVPENLAYFDGHFPMHPIVPGVVQLDWVMTVARDVWGNASAPLRVEALKFKKFLLPRQEFVLSLKRSKDKLSFELHDPKETNEIFSSGRFVFEVVAAGDTPSPGSEKMNPPCNENPCD